MAYGDTMNATDGLAILTDVFLGFIAFLIQNFQGVVLLILIVAFVAFLIKKLANG